MSETLLGPVGHLAGMPHGYCYNWNGFLIILHGLSDLLIGIAYIVIGYVLYHFIRQTSTISPFQPIVLAFAAFITLCGFTHFIDIFTIWYPAFYLSGAVKGATAVASVLTAHFLPKIIPVAHRMIDDARQTSENRAIALAASEANRTKDQFLASISHELRTPLTAVIGYVELLTDGVAGSLSKEQIEYLVRVRASADHLHTIINEILTYTRTEAAKALVIYEPTTIPAIVESARNEVLPQVTRKGLAFVVDAPPTRVCVDAAKVKQVLINVLSNAVRFTDKGMITVSVDVAPDDTVTFRVKDTGIGIDPKHHEDVFQPFWQVDQTMTRARGGTGLGLAVVKQLVTVMGGTVHLRSALGKGTEVIISLPQCEPAQRVA